MKKSRFLSLAILAASVLFTGAAMAQSTELKVATGECSKEGGCSTYVNMFRELKQRCTGDLVLTEVPSKGSVESVDKLLNNELNAGIVQTDVLFWRKRNEDLNNIFTLVALHPEEVHFVAPVNSGLKEGGIGVGSIKLKQTAVKIDTIDQLAGFRVGAVNGSGSFVTARLIRAEGAINYEVVPFDNSDKLKAALEAGEIQAAVYVGGAPLPAVTAYGSGYKLLPASSNLISTLKDVYRSANLNYSALNASGIKTLATEANLVTRGYKTPKMVAALSAFRSCALAQIPEIKEATGTHKKWQAVDPENRGKWAWYELPNGVGSGGTGAAPVAAKKK